MKMIAVMKKVIAQLLYLMRRRDDNFDNPYAIM
jgi:hypothetical protein